MHTVDNDHARAIRADFPILSQKMHNRPLVYLDNASTTQKPHIVIEAIRDYYCKTHANIHRAVYQLGEQATQLFEDTRSALADFIHAKDKNEIVFTKGATDGINLVAACLLQSYFKPGDEIIISTLEHHANLVPWQRVCQQIGMRLRVIPIDADGNLDQHTYARYLSKHTRLVAITHVSNVLGTINPVKEMIALAHQHHIPVLLDSAQAVPHMPVDVQALDCDFLVCSSHKMYGPTGVGVLYAKAAWLAKMPPYQTGGSMIRSVSFAETTYAPAPYKFEAGTQNIAGVVALKAALDYLLAIGMPSVAQHGRALMRYAREALKAVPDLQIVGNPKDAIAALSFTCKNIHPHDVGTALDSYGIAVRVGHHCAMPLMAHLGLPATVRASFGIYNTPQDIDRLVDALLQIRQLFQ